MFITAIILLSVHEESLQWPNLFDRTVYPLARSDRARNDLLFLSPTFRRGGSLCMGSTAVTTRRPCGCWWSSTRSPKSGHSSWWGSHHWHQLSPSFYISRSLWRKIIFSSSIYFSSRSIPLPSCSLPLPSTFSLIPFPCLIIFHLCPNHHPSLYPLHNVTSSVYMFVCLL